MTVREAIRRLAATGDEIYCKICTVDAVDKATRTVDCTPLDGTAPLLDVNLQANRGSEDGIVVFPAVGSYVVVAFVNMSMAVVVLTDNIEKIELKIGETTAEAVDGQITINGGENLGLVKIKELTEKLNQLKDEFDRFVGKYNDHRHEFKGTALTTSGNVVQDGGTINPPTDKADTATLFEKEHYENTSILH